MKRVKMNTRQKFANFLSLPFIGGTCAIDGLYWKHGGPWIGENEADTWEECGKNSDQI